MGLKFDDFQVLKSFICSHGIVMAITLDRDLDRIARATLSKTFPISNEFRQHLKLWNQMKKGTHLVAPLHLMDRLSSQ